MQKQECLSIESNRFNQPARFLQEWKPTLSINDLNEFFESKSSPIRVGGVKGNYTATDGKTSLKGEVITSIIHEYFLRRSAFEAIWFAISAELMRRRARFGLPRREKPVYCEDSDYSYE